MKSALETREEKQPDKPRRPKKRKNKPTDKVDEKKHPADDSKKAAPEPGEAESVIVSTLTESPIRMTTKELNAKITTIPLTALRQELKEMAKQGRIKVRKANGKPNLYGAPGKRYKQRKK